MKKQKSIEDLEAILMDIQGALGALRSDLDTIALNQAKVLERFHELENAQVVLDNRQGVLETKLNNLVCELEKRGVAVSNHLKELLHQFGRSSDYDPALNPNPTESK